MRKMSFLHKEILEHWVLFKCYLPFEAVFCFENFNSSPRNWILNLFTQRTLFPIQKTLKYFFFCSVLQCKQALSLVFIFNVYLIVFKRITVERLNDSLNTSDNSARNETDIFCVCFLSEFTPRKAWCH